MMEPSSQLESACLRVFAIPELAHLICKPTRKRDNVSLMRVCRQLFYNVCPFVWETTDAVVTLLSMIPGGGVVLVGDDLLPSLAVMQFPSTLDLSRLQVYAPYVKNLEIPLESHIDEYENWDGFLDATRSANLLPNLEHICFSPQTFNAVVISEISVNWALAFLSSSLLSLRIAPFPLTLDFSYPNFTFVKFELAHRLLDEISEECPRLESLELFIGDAVTQSNGRFPGGHQVASRVNFSDGPLGIPSILSRFQSLRTLTITPLILVNDALLVLAQLPSLASLTICGLHSDMQVYGQDLTLPDNSFLSLRHLALQYITWGTVLNLCRQASIWQGLNSLQIHGFKPYRWPEEDDSPHLLSEILSSLVDHRAPITTLSLTGASRQLISRQMAESLKHLPLTSLSLSSCDSDHPHLESMLSSLPSLLELSIQIHPGFHLPQLRLIITSLPRLRNLSIHMDYHALDDLQMDEIVRPRVQSQGSFCLASNIHVSEPQDESVEKIARYLYALKPNMVYAQFGVDLHFSNGIHWVNPTDVLINEALLRLRATSVGEQ